MKQGTENNNKYTAALWQHYHNSGRIPVIPDIKSRSPGEGDLLRGRDPVKLMQSLEGAGAPAFSVVTEKEHFGGSLALLAKIAEMTSRPVLRKDFITRREQLMDSKECGASAVLLIASMLTKKQLFDLAEESLNLGLEPLVETHNQREVQIANQLNLTFLGINNRDIIKLETDNGNVGNTEKLAKLVFPGVFILSESAIASPQDVKRAREAGAHGVLVGTAIINTRDPVKAYGGLSDAGR